MRELNLGSIGKSHEDEHQTRIMLVDDDELVISVLEAGLSNMGYLVAAYESPLKALDCYQEFDPDLVVLDFEMPGMNGATLAEKLLSKMYRPIIVLSVHFDEVGWKKAIQAGVINYLVKPVSAAQLRPAIETTLSSYRNLHDLIDQDKSSDSTIPGSSAAVLDQLGFGVIVVSSSLGVARVNSQAEKLLSELSSILIIDGKIRLMDSLFRDQFDAFALSEEPAIALLLQESDNSYPVFIKRLKNESFIGYTFFLLNLELAADLSEDLVSMLYGLTGREVRIAKSIYAGMSIEDYCVRYFVSANTAKTQLKSVFLKTGVHSQAQLVGKLASLTNPLVS